MGSRWDLIAMGWFDTKFRSDTAVIYYINYWLLLGETPRPSMGLDSLRKPAFVEGAS